MTQIVILTAETTEFLALFGAALAAVGWVLALWALIFRASHEDVETRVLEFADELVVRLGEKSSHNQLTGKPEAAQALSDAAATIRATAADLEDRWLDA